MVWQGQGDAPYVAEVDVTILNVNGQDKPGLQVRLSNGDHYNTDLKTTHITVDATSGGAYNFSGSVHKDTEATSDDILKTLNVEGSIMCANYGPSAGCTYASLSEMSAASRLSLNETENRGLDGCLYSSHSGGNLQYVKVELFPTAGWEDHVNRQASGSHSSEVLPGIGQEAEWVSPVVFVKANAQRSFLVLVAPSQGENDEIAVAKVIAPRIESDLQ